MAQEQQLSLSLLPNIENILNFKPHQGRVIIKPSPEVELISKGGIILSDKSKDERRKFGLSCGEIISVANSGINEVKVGQTVFFSWGQGEGMIRSGEDIYLIFQECIISAHLEEPELVVNPVGEIVENEK